MVGYCVDDVLESLTCLRNKRWLPYVETQRLRVFEVDLTFIKIFLRCCVSRDSDADLRSIFTSIDCIWADDRLSEDLDKLLDMDVSSRKESRVFNKLGEKILLSKQQIKKHCEPLMSKSWTSSPLTSHEIQQFLGAIIINMDHLVADEEILPMKNLIEPVKEKLLIFCDLVEFTAMRSVDCKSLENFNIHVLSWATTAACLTFIYREADEHNKSCGKNVSEKDRICLLVADLLKKVNPCTPEFIEMCFAVIQYNTSSHSHIILLEELVPSFVDFLLQNLMSNLIYDVRILREGLICLITFLVGPSLNSAEDSELNFFQTQIEAVLIEASRLICLFSRDKVALTNGNIFLVKLLKMIDQVKAKINNDCIQLPHSSWSYFPRTNGLGFVENLVLYLEDMKETMSSHPKFVPSLKHQISRIKVELTSLLPFLHDTSESVNDIKNLKEIWEEIISLAYHAELVLKQSFFIDRTLCISYVLRKIQAINSKVVRVEDEEIYITGIMSSLMSPANMLTVTAPTFCVDEEMVGFKEDQEVLIDRLTRGTKKLDIISIVGMGGIGKTTLAKKLYKEASVRLWFHKKAFCTVSQGYRRKKMLGDILTQLIGNVVDVMDMTEEDLVLRLYKSLKGYRYLIVLDDIWDINAWNDVKDSFPDDHNGSRVMFTTRINDLSFLAKPNSDPHRLRFLTIDQSWDLLQLKIFHKDACPPSICEVGRLIAKNCKGLPLAIVVIAGLLAISERSLSWWQKVAHGLATYFSSERCRSILELSYKHLSEASKPCFLYLGAFPEDTIFTAGEITKLWVAERFVLKSDRRCMDKVAKEHLNYLADRSLLVVMERSLAGDIKSFRLHDVIREFCISKAQEEQLLWMVNGDDDNFSMPFIYNQYRICIQAGCGSFLDANPSGPAVHSLLCFEKMSYTYKCITNSLFRKFRLIEVLDLRPVKFLDFPTGITMLVFLRYLALTYDRSLGHVPPTIVNLQNLETLLIEGAKDVCLPDTIWKMKRLRHMKFPDGCRLQGLDDVESEAFSQLPDLERLGWVKIRDKNEGEALLRRLPNVRKLRFKFWECPEQLVNLSKLESLRIAWYGDNFNHPSSLSFPSNLRRLTLVGFQLPGKELSTMIGKPPCLEVLKLIGCRFHGNRWEAEDDEFPVLKCLTLMDLQIEYWSATTESFPSMEKLILYNCSKLEEVPPCFGEVPTLRALQEWDCSEGVSTSAIRIQEDQLEMGNDSLEFLPQ